MDDRGPAGGVLAGLVNPGRVAARHAGTAGPPRRPDVAAAGTTLGLPAGLLVLVTRTPDRDGLLRCDTRVLTPQRPPACSAIHAPSGTIVPGMRFTDPVSGLEVVCTRAGHGVLSFDGRPLHLTSSESTGSTS